MIINCQKEDLLLAIQTVGRAISTKNTLPVLAGILINAKENIISLRTTDLDIAIQCSIPADVMEAGEMVIADGKRFIDIVRQLPDGNINLSLINDYDINIKYGQSSLNIRGFDTDQFPMLPGLDGEIRGTMAGEVFARMIKQTIVAVATEETRPVLTGILVNIAGDEITMVSTDSHRLAMAKGKWQGDATLKMVIPSRTMQEAAKIAANEENIEIIINKNNVAFTMGNNILISRLINGQYPDYMPLLPKEDDFNSNIFVEKKILNDALSRANLLSRDNSNIVKLNLTTDQIVLTANSPEIGNIKEIIPANITGDSLMVGYNVKYILEALRVIPEDNIIIRLTGPISPGIIVPEADDSYLYLILPIRISS